MHLCLIAGRRDVAWSITLTGVTSGPATSIEVGCFDNVDNSKIRSRVEFPTAILPNVSNRPTPSSRVA